MSALSRLFARRADSEHWKAGDLAECINRGPWIRFSTGKHNSGPQYGERHVVLAAEAGESGYLMLTFARYLPRCYDARGFRKVTPRADATVAADAAFIEQMRQRELVR